MNLGRCFKYEKSNVKFCGNSCQSFHSTTFDYPPPTEINFFDNVEEYSIEISQCN